MDDLLDLRRVAMDADDQARPWVWQTGTGLGRNVQRVLRQGDVILVAECFEDPDMPSVFAEYITTFDPPTVLRLLDRLLKETDVFHYRDAARAALAAHQEPDEEGFYPDCSPRCDWRGGAIHASDCPHRESAGNPGPLTPEVDRTVEKLVALQQHPDGKVRSAVIEAAVKLRALASTGDNDAR